MPPVAMTTARDHNVALFTDLQDIIFRSSVRFATGLRCYGARLIESHWKQCETPGIETPLRAVGFAIDCVLRQRKAVRTREETPSERGRWLYSGRVAFLRAGIITTPTGNSKSLCVEFVGKVNRRLNSFPGHF